MVSGINPHLFEIAVRETLASLGVKLGDAFHRRYEAETFLIRLPLAIRW